MTILVGVGPEGVSAGGLELAMTFARSSGLGLVVCCVIPDRWQSVGPGRQVDADYEAYLRGLATETLDRAREIIGPDPEIDATYEVRTARSAPSGLVEAIDTHDVRLLVASSSAQGAWGHIALGSVTDRLLHSSPVPIALAPRGYRSVPGGRVERITVAVDGTAASQSVLERAAEVANAVHARVRIVSFAVRAGTMYPPELGLRVEERVANAWREDACRVVEESLAALDDDLVLEPQLHVSEGRTWREALEEPGWEATDVLVIGSSTSQSVLSRVFLGSTATRIIRHSPVPVVVVPASSAED